MVIAGSNTFYMKIDDKSKFIVTSWYSGFLERYYLTPYLTNKKVSWKHKEMTDKKQAQKWED